MDHNITPQMSQKEIRFFENILLKYRQHVDVLEWGTGGSTVYFTSFLRKNNISYIWTSIEYNREWYDYISEMTKRDECIHLFLFDVGNTKLKQRDVSMEDYITRPAMIGKKYDIILVDGRKRRRCLLEAKKLLKPEGVVILHDAQRKYYHCVFSEYPDSRRVLRKFWIGKIKQPNFFLRNFNRIRYWYFRLYEFFYWRVYKKLGF